MGTDPQPDTRMGVSETSQTEDDTLKEALQSINGRSFEFFVSELWDAMGWETEVTRENNDDGVDIIARRDGIYPQKRLIQAKRLQSGDSINRRQVQQVSYLHTKSDVDEVILVTTGTFTRGARTSADRANVKLVDIDDLLQLVREYADAEKLREHGYVRTDSGQNAFNDEGAGSVDHPLIEQSAISHPPAPDPKSKPQAPGLDTDNPVDVDFGPLLRSLPDQLSYRTRFALLLQQASSDPLDVAVIAPPSMPVDKIGAWTQCQRPTLSVNCSHVSERTLYGDYDRGKEKPALLTAGDPDVIWLKQFDNLSNRDKLAEPLNQHLLTRADGTVNQRDIGSSLLLTTEPRYGTFDQYETLYEQIPISPRIAYSCDAVCVDVGSHYLSVPPALQIETSGSGVSEDRLRTYLSKARAKEIDVSEIDFNRVLTVLEQFIGEDEDLTIRELPKKDTLLRLSTACAKLRLGDAIHPVDIAYSLQFAWPLACRSIAIGEFSDVWGELLDKSVTMLGYELENEIEEKIGTTKSQRDRIEDLKTLIEDIEDEYEDGAPVDVIVERADRAGMDRAKAEHEIEQLKQKGEAYEPRTDHLRTT
ncbi:restriction endonuclease [Halosimplex sp. TS25]|uniref:restriction endonuclease n=1 Tax=Halosimplex rarum TaxID=3396619 RepID=UPI0039EA4A1D